MASIKELPSDKAFRFERIGAHTHIKGLGLNKKGTAIKIKEGLVGQERAREAAGLVVRMIQEGRLSGKTIILAGPPGTGKTAIAVARSPKSLAKMRLHSDERQRSVQQRAQENRSAH